jgi:hypothetical protein
MYKLEKLEKSMILSHFRSDLELKLKSRESSEALGGPKSLLLESHLSVEQRPNGSQKDTELGTN